MINTALVRYGRIPETSRLTLRHRGFLARGSQVVVRTVRGLELATLLQDADEPNDDAMLSAGTNGESRSDIHLTNGAGSANEVSTGTITVQDEVEGISTTQAANTMHADDDLADFLEQPGVLRAATDDDLATAAQRTADCEAEFATWQQRIDAWQLDLAVIDLERTLDGQKLILYVLNERGPDCTKLAIQAAAAGLGIIEVQSVGTTGLSAPNQSGGCATGGCGSGGCH